MCGIAGVWHRAGAPADRGLLQRMGDVLRHRGPDGEGMHVDGPLGLVHRRLRILDLSDCARQPMATPDGALWLNYNGEIHNFVELRRELQAAGVRFRSTGDTEVVLWSYRVWGLECFERFNGMWALALWEPRAQRLLLSRDRFGIKPLYYSVRGPRVAFASEVKAILEAFPEERAAAVDEVRAFLSGAYPDGGAATFFANVRSLAAGSLVTFSPEEERVRPYWSFRPGCEAPAPDAPERFAELLRDSVRLRMRSDVPVGTCLSGGLDSSAVLRLAAPFAQRPFHCFSLIYDDPRIDESRYAAAAADDPERFLVHWVRPESDDLLDTMAWIVWHHDAPTPMRGRLAQWFVMREAGRHVRVVLDGQGSDELLGGYVEFVLPYLLDRLRLPPAPGASRFSVLSELAALARVDGRPQTLPLRMLVRPLRRRLGLDRSPPARFVSRDFVRSGPSAPAERFGHTWSRSDVPRPFASHLNNALWLHLRHAGLGEVLHAEDALSMAFSVEARTPFLDHRVVELCFSLPYHEKIRGGWTKSLLRRALRDELPPTIRDRRRKLGFPAPVAEWLTAPRILPAVRELLLEGPARTRGILDRPRMAARLTAAAEGRSDLGRHVMLLWRLVTLELWFRQFIDASARRPATFP